MSNIKKYKSEFDSIYSLSVEIDHDILTDEKMHEINNFWSGSERRFDEAGENIAHCIIKLLHKSILPLQAYHDFNVVGVVGFFDYNDEYNSECMEGWPKMDGSTGIKIIECDMFEFDADDISVSECK